MMGFIRAIAFLLIAASCWAQQCSVPFSFTAAAQVSASFNNIQVGCTRWTVVYSSTGFSAVSLTVQSAPDATGVAGTFVTFAGTVTTGSNPNTATTSAYTNFTGLYPWLRVILSSVTGTGSVTGILYGWRETASATSGSGGAPTDATYIVQTANASLSAEQAMGALATGLVKNTTTTGVQSIAVAGTDFISPTPLTGSTQLLYDSAAGTAALSPLFREDANTVAQRNSTAAQQLFTYNTISGGNYERMQVGWSGSTANLIVEKGGTGVVRNFRIQTAAGSGSLLLGSNGNDQWIINGSGLLSANGSSQQIVLPQGTLSGSSTPAYTHTATWSNAATPFVDDFRNIVDTNSAAASLLAQWQVGGVDQFRIRKDGKAFLRGDLAIATAGAATINVGSNANVYFGNINSTATLDFNVPTGSFHSWQINAAEVFRLTGTATNALATFGGTTSSFPALKRSTTDLQARLGDDSDFTSFQGKYKSTDGTAGATTTCTIAGLISITIKNGLVTGCS